eukprot:CAMPEP_0174386554 /NCGR_PEP_ID=MMETSP0811_2-20130205/127356_1 /TAXON_ID=73025 ORGANISM="Eutreptiella gymnastica-like, Strain CCMP1594" /NCGR_SAMPLE_ID=MMETSP0811_2 /ASSEMBLY_ACC=CAM_ASM_000667 /LENGTH=101 /DNA_ID=CAMNT_0015541267 /DNA_START=206 /DNA_END=511 /DNA_ORIENTATION=+
MHSHMVDRVGPGKSGMERSAYAAPDHPTTTSKPTPVPGDVGKSPGEVRQEERQWSSQPHKGGRGGEREKALQALLAYGLGSVGGQSSPGTSAACSRILEHE